MTAQSQGVCSLTLSGLGAGDGLSTLLALIARTHMQPLSCMYWLAMSTLRPVLAQAAPRQRRYDRSRHTRRLARHVVCFRAPFVRRHSDAARWHNTKCKHIVPHVSRSSRPAQPPCAQRSTKHSSFCVCVRPSRIRHSSCWLTESSYHRAIQ